jgi:hypothetical protein
VTIIINRPMQNWKIREFRMTMSDVGEGSAPTSLVTLDKLFKVSVQFKISILILSSYSYWRTK